MVTVKADSVPVLEGMNPPRVMANAVDTTGVDEQGMCIKGWAGNLRGLLTPRGKKAPDIQATGIEKGPAQNRQSSAWVAR